MLRLGRPQRAVVVDRAGLRLLDRLYLILVFGGELQFVSDQHVAQGKAAFIETARVLRRQQRTCSCERVPNLPGSDAASEVKSSQEATEPRG